METELMIPEDHLPALSAFAKAAEGAYAKNTERAVRADLKIFAEWCRAHDHPFMPSTPEAVAWFIDHLTESAKLATIRRYLASITMLHGAANVASPTTALIVKLAMRRAAKALGQRQRQAAPANRLVMDRFSRGDSGSLRDLRDLAMFAVAYDTLCRRSELVALDVSDLHRHEDGSGTVLIRKSKTDQEGIGHVRYVAQDTLALVQRWCDSGGVRSGALFRGILTGDKVIGRLSDQGFWRAMKRFCARSGLPAKSFSGHSCRVGAAQDMVAVGIDLPGIMQAGGWKSPIMVARYTEHLAAQRGAAAKLARSQNRTCEKGFDR